MACNTSTATTRTNYYQLFDFDSHQWFTRIFEGFFTFFITDEIIPHTCENESCRFEYTWNSV